MRRLLYEPHRRRISVEYDPDSLVDSWDEHPEIDRDATIHEYGLSLSKYLADEFGSPGVEVQPVDGLQPPTRITVEPEPADFAELDRLVAAIHAACEAHWARGDFWVER